MNERLNFAEQVRVENAGVETPLPKLVPGMPPIVSAALSRASKKHGANEDAWSVDVENGLVVIADGVGGHYGARAASLLAAKTIVEYLARAAHRASADSAQFRPIAIARAIQFVHRLLRRKNQNAIRSRDKMATTIAGLWFDPGMAGKAWAFNVGDSPIYRIPPTGSAEVISAEHSVYQAWLDNGGVGDSPSRKYITQAIGVGKAVSPHIVSLDFHKGDRFVICSDGLAESVTLEELGREIATSPSPGAACRSLMNKISHENQADDATLIVCGATGSF